MCVADLTAEDAEVYAEYAEKLQFNDNSFFATFTSSLGELCGSTPRP